MKTARLIVIIIFVLIMGCAENRAKELFEIAEFEELQRNHEHAISLYREIIARHPDTTYAPKAKKKLAELRIKTGKGERTMTNTIQTDYTVFDRPEILNFLFHPRPAPHTPPPVENATVLMIPVEHDITIGAKFHHSDKAAPTILFFHGNGEIIYDYDDLGMIYTENGINFFPVDYRGYGQSTGTPTVSGMMKDCHTIFKYAKNRLSENGYTGPLIVMGRSLGSASALELAGTHGSKIDGLIIESGFAYAVPLMKLLGVNTTAAGITEDKGFRNIDKIKEFNKATLIIHAEYDHIIPFTDGQALYDASSAPDKKLLKIPGADHNTIFAYSIEEYMNAVNKLAHMLSR